MCEGSVHEVGAITVSNGCSVEEVSASRLWSVFCMSTTTSTLLQRAAIGAAAGIGATLLMQAMMKASPKVVPGGEPPLREDAGEFMIGKVVGDLPIPPLVRKTAAKSLHLGYGTTPAVLYALIRHRDGSAIVDGTLLGLGVWAAGYLGWLPAAGLIPPMREQPPRQIAVPIVRHALFGIAVVAAYRAMTR